MVPLLPSLEHETLRLLFQNRPELAPALLRDALGVELPEYSSVRVESADLTDIVPAEYRADLVVLLVDGKPVLAIVVEVQLAQDERKAANSPELAVLSVLAHGRDEVEVAVKVALAAMSAVTHLGDRDRFAL